MIKPYAASPPAAPGAGMIFCIEYVQGDDGGPCFCCGCVQGGVVKQAQVIAEPNNNGRNVRHSASIIVIDQSAKRKNGLCDGGWFFPSPKHVQIHP